MPFSLTRRAAIIGAVTAAAAPAFVPGQRAANASLPGQTGQITFKRGGQVWIAAADGTSERMLLPDVQAGSGAWAPDGSRFVYSAGTRLVSVRPDGSDRVELAVVNASQAVEPVYTHDGAYVVSTVVNQYMSRLSIIAAGGNWTRPAQLYSYIYDPYDGKGDCNAAVAADGTIVYQHGTRYDGDIYRLNGFTSVSKLIDNGWAPDFSPDGSKLAFVRPVSTGGDQIWVAAANGTGATQLTTVANTGSTANTDPAWSNDGGSILFTSVEGSTPKIKRIDVGSGEVVTVVDNGSEPTCQPVNPNAVERVWGATAIGTAVATSRYNWADHGVDDGVRAQAEVVVLSRDDTYLDALGGSALAVSKRGPLLITPPGRLDPQIEAEIQRILGGSGTVYLLGGTVALSTGVENRLKSLGYTIVRLWGQDEYETAVAIAKEITATPAAVIVATSLKYYDALAAGAAAGANPGTVVVLSAGNTLPAATARYLNTLNPDPDTGTHMIGVGGPGLQALVNGHYTGKMPNWPDNFAWYQCVGATEFETAVAVADFFFDGPRTAAVATATTWFDALTGGAMIGANGGPLLLSTPGTLSPATRDYFSRHAGALTYGVLLGGPLALNNSLIAPLGQAISLPGQYGYDQYTETSAPTAATSFAPSSSPHQRAAKTAQPGTAPGFRQPPSRTNRR